MTDIRLRPRFRMLVECSAQELLAAIDDGLRKGMADDVGEVDGAVYDSSAVLRIPGHRQHYWSPELQVGVDEDGRARSVVTGLYGPRPSVWSLFLAIYAFLAFVALMASAYATAQLLMDQPAYAFWALPFVAILGVLVYAAGRVGRTMGHDQMTELRQFLDDVIARQTAAIRP